MFKDLDFLLFKVRCDFNLKDLSLKFINFLIVFVFILKGYRKCDICRKFYNERNCFVVVFNVGII